MAIESRHSNSTVLGANIEVVAAVRKTGSAAEGEEREGLLADLKEIVVLSGEEGRREWHKKLRCVSIENICDFLHGTAGREFSRKEFARFLEKIASNGGDKYKTAGVYLKILTRNDVCEHNGQQANRSGYVVLAGKQSGRG